MSIFNFMLASILCFSAMSFSQVCPPLVVPDQFSIIERIISFNSSLVIKDLNKKSYGKVSRRFFSLSRQFYFHDTEKKLIANGRARIFSWGHHVDITDCNGKKIGAIKEQIFPAMITGGIYSVYTFLDDQNQITARTQKVELVSTSFDIFTAQAPQTQVATVTRSFLGKLFNDRWSVNVYNNSAVDKRILIMLAAFKTSMDNDQARQDRNNQDLDEDTTP